MSHHVLSLPKFFQRRRDDAVQAHRASFVATPTAELSQQEERLLGDILDWSLDTSSSGYEGDQEEESEGEKDGDCEWWGRDCGLCLIQRCLWSCVALRMYRWANLHSRDHCLGFSSIRTSSNEMTKQAIISNRPILVAIIPIRCNG